MARPSKVNIGKTRSLLLRQHQLQQLEGVAKGLGCDVSDVVRATIDWLFPLDPADLQARTWAALELHWREVRPNPHLMRAVLDGWRGKEMTIPLGMANRPDTRLALAVVDMIRQLGLPPPEDPNPDDLPLRCGWANVAPDRLLRVLSSPAVRVIDVAGDGTPLRFLTSSAIDPARETTLPELQYTPPAEGLKELIRAGEVEEERGYGAGPPGPAQSWHAFRIDWARLGYFAAEDVPRSSRTRRGPGR